MCENGKEDMMGRETILFNSEEKKSAAEAAAMLRIIADKVESGTMSLASGTSEIDLVIPENVTLEIKVEEEEGRNSLKRSLEVEIEWREGESLAPDGVTIS